MNEKFFFLFSIFKKITIIFFNNNYFFIVKKKKDVLKLPRVGSMIFFYSNIMTVINVACSFMSRNICLKLIRI